jgi:ATP-binding cassette subfamily F protein 2
MDTVCTQMMDLTTRKKLLYYGGNYTTYVRTKSENETNQMKAYQKQQDEIQHIKSGLPELAIWQRICSDPNRSFQRKTEFIASAGTYANLVRQAKSKQKVGCLPPTVSLPSLTWPSSADHRQDGGRRSH